MQHYKILDVQTTEFLLVQVEVHDDTRLSLSLVGPVVLKLVVVELGIDAAAQCSARLAQFTVRLQILSSDTWVLRARRLSTG